MTLALGAWECPSSCVLNGPLPAPPDPNAFNMTPNPVTVLQGDSADLVLGSTQVGTVGWFTVPSGVTLSRDFVPVNPGTERHVAVQAAYDAPPGPSQVIARLYFPNTNELDTLDVNVERPFTIATAGSISGRAGESIVGAVTVSRHVRFNGVITLTFSGLPPNAVATIQTQPGGAVSNIAYSINIPGGTGPGIWAAELVASSGRVTQRQAVSLGVLPALPVPDFRLQVSPALVSMFPTDTRVVDIDITRSGSPMPGAIAFTIGGLPPGVTASFAPTTATGPASQLTVTSAGAPLVGPLNVVVTGTAGTLVRTVPMALTIEPRPNIALTVQPSAVSLQGVVTVPVKVAVDIARTGAVGGVTLVALDVPPGVTATFKLGTVNGAADTISLSANGTSVVGTYPVTIRGTAGAIVSTTTLMLTVVAPPPASDFSVSFVPSTLSVFQGESVEIPISITRSGTMIGANVQFAVTDGPALSFAWVTLLTTTTNSATASLIIGGNTPPGPYRLSVTGTNSSSAVRSATIPITVQPSGVADYALLPSPTSFFVGIQSAAQFTMRVLRTNGFGDFVAFSVASGPPNLSVQFTPLSTSGNLTTINIYASDLLSPGSYPLVIEGRTATGLVRRALVTLVLLPP